MAQRFPPAGPGGPPPSGAPPPGGPPGPGGLQAPRFAGPAPPQVGPMPPRPYPGPNFPQRSGFTPPPGGAGGVAGVPGGGAGVGAGGARGPPGPPAPPPRPAPATPPPQKRPPDNRSPMPPQHKPIYNEGYGGGAGGGGPGGKRKKRLADKILPQKVRDLVPESQAYMDLLAFERKLDSTIMRKRLDIQEALKRPMKQKRKLRIFISNTFYPGGGEGAVASWELRVEGRLLDDAKSEPNKVKRKFSSFFKSLVIELDKELYGPDNHLVEWHRTLSTQETDGFQVKRPGYKDVRCTILLLLDYQPLQFKLDGRLARLLGVHTQARPVIVNALWQYIKTHGLQDPNEREYITCDKYLEQIFGVARMKLAEVPARLQPLLHAPDPIVINHVISVESGGASTGGGGGAAAGGASTAPDGKQTACYDIDVEVDDTLKQQMNAFLLATAAHHEIHALDAKIHETVDTINQLKTNREFFLSFSKDPQQFIHKWLISQSRDLKTMTSCGAGSVSGAAGAGGGGAGAVGGEGEAGRGAAAWRGAWCAEGAARYLARRAAARRRDLDHALTRL